MWQAGRTFFFNIVIVNEGCGSKSGVKDPLDDARAMQIAQPPAASLCEQALNVYPAVTPRQARGPERYLEYLPQWEILRLHALTRAFCQ